VGAGKAVAAFRGNLVAATHLTGPRYRQAAVVGGQRSRSDSMKTIPVMFAMNTAVGVGADFASDSVATIARKENEHG
jgi:hypothetical protein